MEPRNSPIKLSDYPAETGRCVQRGLRQSIPSKRQRHAIAMALRDDPDILIIRPPTTATRIGNRQNLNAGGVFVCVHKDKRGKTDKADAAAICEAVSRPSMRFVPVKSQANRMARTAYALMKNRTEFQAAQAA